MEGKDSCCASILIIERREETNSYPDRDLKSLPMGILVFMILPVLKNWEQNGIAAQKYAYPGKIRDVWSWKISFLSTSPCKKESHSMWKSCCLLLLCRRVFEKGQMPANLSMGRKEWMVVKGWGKSKFRTRENVIMKNAAQAVDYGVREWKNLLAGQ